jgi:fatty acid desaturase
MTAQYVYAEREPNAARTPPSIDELSQSALHRRFKPLFRPRPIIYWSDMLASAAIGWTAFAHFVTAEPVRAGGIAAFVVAVFALYRSVLFIHEIAHLKHRSIDGFIPAWNLLVGIPLLVPSLMYAGTHADHHRRSQFATIEDPEYEAIAAWDVVRIASSFLVMLVVPAALALRWGLLGPLSYLFPPLRRLVVERASSLVINPTYRRRLLKDDEVWSWALQEGLAALVVWGVVAAVALGWIPASWVFRWYLVPSAILLLNHARTLAAHRYDNEERAAVDRVGQLLDSINLTGGSWLTALAAPVGLRYHALHHLLPTLPYHSLGVVHRTLERELPVSSPYRDTALPTMAEGFGGMLAYARRHAARTVARQPSYASRPR